ncbi:hypothetical protein J6590_005700 [Homalodisca vitripennis]|nr:hypothetical protein J6590_005700 [Homalodisca vitripennis]
MENPHATKFLRPLQPSQIGGRHQLVKQLLTRTGKIKKSLKLLGTINQSSPQLSITPSTVSGVPADNVHVRVTLRSAIVCRAIVVTRSVNLRLTPARRPGGPIFLISRLLCCPLLCSRQPIPVLEVGGEISRWN